MLHDFADIPLPNGSLSLYYADDILVWLADDYLLL